MSRPSAMPEGHEAIRVQFEENEPPALIFHEQAQPSALVSWSWCQLSALNSLLDAIICSRRGPLGEPDVAGAVQAVLVPVINALSFSEQRAHEIRQMQLNESIGRRQVRHGGSLRKATSPAKARSKATVAHS